MAALSWKVRIYIAAISALAVTLLIRSVPLWDSSQNFRFCLYLALVVAAANLKVRLPGITGAMSVTFVFVLISLPVFGLPQVISIGLAGAGGTLLFRAKSRNWVKLVFNLSSSAVASAACFGVFHWSWLRSQNDSLPILLLFASAVQFALNTGFLSLIIAMTEHKLAWRVWYDNFFWTASHNLVGAGMAAVFHVEERYFGWEATVLTIPVVWLVYRSYSLHLERLESARKHAQEMGDLHWRTIEALALAIDAKDETTHNHLLRVKVYATEICKEMKLSDLEVQAIQAAALLHDLGKLAVPEHIISKPGKLTPEEFEKMKVHPVVGAEILERVRFPYPVVPIVRSHHEKWNGKGYPDGLKGTQIPIGARILAAVDCLDALASDRQYRKALPLDQAMAIVEKDAGQSFDPEVVAILKRRYIELEKMATSQPVEDEPKLSRNVKVDAGEGPASGYAEMCDLSAHQGQADFRDSITAARREFQSLMRIVEELGNSLSVDETLNLLASRLKKMIPHQSTAVFVREGDSLNPVYSTAEPECWRPTAAIAVGDGLTGWVAETHQPIVNGNPSVEPGYYSAGRPLVSAISVPLEANDDVVGLVTLYSVDPNAFTQDHLRILQQISPKAGLALANALKHEKTVSSAVTDELTGLPNSRALAAHMRTRLEAAREGNSSFAVVMLDLNGFKAVNDKFGHLTGNRVLTLVSEALRKSFADDDYIARMGGDEFVVLLANRLNVNPALARLNALVHKIGQQTCGSDGLSLSAGTSYFPADGELPENLIAAADRRMYSVKEAHHAGAPESYVA